MYVILQGLNINESYSIKFVGFILNILKYLERCEFMYRRRNMPYVAPNKIIKIAETPVEKPFLNENQLEAQLEEGYINVRVNTALGALPVADALVTLYIMDHEGNEEVLYHHISNISGVVPKMTLPVIFNPEDPLESSEYFFSTYNLRVQAIGYYTQNIMDVRVFSNRATNFNVTLIPVCDGGGEDENIHTVVIPPSPIDISNV